MTLLAFIAGCVLGFIVGAVFGIETSPGVRCPAVDQLGYDKRCERLAGHEGPHQATFAGRSVHFE